MTGDSGSSAGEVSSSSGPDVALKELGRAITRAADALAAVPSNDEATAYRCARALDTAFGDLADLLQAVPGIVGLGAPGRSVSERLEQRRAELATRRDEVTAYRANLDELAETESVLSAWSQADADLAVGLQAAGFGPGDNALEAVQAELSDIRDRLIDLDDKLRPLLKGHAMAYEEARRVRRL
jgi:hypothetical protein